MKTKCTLLILGLFALSVGSTFAANITVAKSGGDYTKIQAALDVAVPGDVITVKAGTYSEKIEWPVSGTSGNYITLKGEAGAVINNGLSGDAFYIEDISYIIIDGLEISSCVQAIEIGNACSNIYIQNCYMHGCGDNSNALVIYAHGGSSNTPTSNIYILNNDLSYNNTGNSEVCTINGNVDGFTIKGNHIHHNNNIGIDIIGYESGNGPTALNYARNGVVTDNIVEYISTEGGAADGIYAAFPRNPTYSENDYSAGGIYVDGGQNIIIERNIVRNCDIGIELASEWKGKYTENITVRNNIVSGSYQGNLQAGGYESGRGNARNCSFINNTTSGARDAGELVLQFNCTNITVKNNIFISAGNDYIEDWGEDGSNTVGVVIAHNIYFGGSTDETGSFTDTDPIFSNPKLAADFRLTSASAVAFDAGVTAESGLFDIDNQTRIQGLKVDMGADEYYLTTNISQQTIEKTSIKAYPNPAVDIVTIETAENIVGKNLSIFNVFGQELMKIEINSPTTNINISNLNSGVYFVKSLNNNAVEVLRLIKK